MPQAQTEEVAADDGDASPASTSASKTEMSASAIRIQKVFRGVLERTRQKRIADVVSKVADVVNIRDKFAATRVRLQWLATHKDEMNWADENTKNMFRNEEERLRNVLAQLEEGGHVHFAVHEDNMTDVDVMLQGNPEFYSDHFLYKRNKLAHSTLIRSVTWMFWHLASGATVHHDADHLEFDQYRELFVRLCKVLQPVFKLDAAYEAALVDWQHDSKQFYLDLHGQTVMTGEAFHRSIFELVDTWTNVVDEEAYVNWLIALLWAVCEDSSAENEHYNLVLRPLDEVRDCLDIDGTLHVPPRYWDERDHLMDIALGIQERREFPQHVAECFHVPLEEGEDDQPEGHDELMRLLYDRREARRQKLMSKMKYKASLAGAMGARTKYGTLYHSKTQYFNQEDLDEEDMKPGFRRGRPLDVDEVKNRRLSPKSSHVELLKRRSQSNLLSLDNLRESNTVATEAALKGILSNYGGDVSREPSRAYRRRQEFAAAEQERLAQLRARVQLQKMQHKAPTQAIKVRSGLFELSDDDLYNRSAWRNRSKQPVRRKKNRGGDKRKTSNKGEHSSRRSHDGSDSFKKIMSVSAARHVQPTYLSSLMTTPLGGAVRSSVAQPSTSTHHPYRAAAVSYPQQRASTSPASSPRSAATSALGARVGDRSINHEPDVWQTRDNETTGAGTKARAHIAQFGAELMGNSSLNSELAHRAPRGGAKKAKEAHSRPLNNDIPEAKSRAGVSSTVPKQGAVVAQTQSEVKFPPIASHSTGFRQGNVLCSDDVQYDQVAETKLGEGLAPLPASTESDVPTGSNEIEVRKQQAELGRQLVGSELDNAPPPRELSRYTQLKGMLREDDTKLEFKYNNDKADSPGRRLLYDNDEYIHSNFHDHFVNFGSDIKDEAGLGRAEFFPVLPPPAATEEKARPRRVKPRRKRKERKNGKGAILPPMQHSVMPKLQSRQDEVLAKLSAMASVPKASKRPAAVHTFKHEIAREHDRLHENLQRIVAADGRAVFGEATASTPKRGNRKSSRFGQPPRENRTATLPPIAVVTLTP